MGKKVFYLASSFIVFLCLMAIGHFLLKPSGVDNVYVLNEGWTVSYNDTVFENVKLSELRGLIGSGTYKGDLIVMKRELPDLDSYVAPSVLFQSRFSAWRFIIDGTPLAEWHFDSYENGKFVGCETTYFTLSSQHSHSTLELDFLVTEDGAYNSFTPPILGSYQDLLMYTIFDNMFILMSSFFFIIFGVLFLAISIGFRSALPEVDVQIYSSILYITLGVWFLAQFNLFDFIINTDGHETEIEYISLYLIVPLMYLVMGSVHDFLRQRIFLSFAIVSTIFALIPIILHYMNIYHINEFLPLYQLNAFILFILNFTMVVIDSKQGKLSPSQLIQLAGMSMISLSFIFNVIFFYMEVAGVSKQIMLSKKAVPMGTFCMVFTTLVNYYLYISESYARKKEYNSLAHLAYADGLTNIPNRSRYEKYLNDLTSKGEDYCIISIDLNGLKSINDNIGHLMGDRYLSEFSEAFEICFNDKAFIARIGGDEFVAVLNGENINEADELIRSLNAALAAINKHDPSIPRSVAAGYAYKHEADDDSWNSVYLLADERMYANKMALKH